MLSSSKLIPISNPKRLWPFQCSEREKSESVEVVPTNVKGERISGSPVTSGVLP